MMTWLKRFVRAKILTLVLAFVSASFLLFPPLPVSQQHILAHWLTPVAYAQGGATSILQDLLERTGLYTPPRNGTAPKGRGRGGAGRGPICALTGKGTEFITALVPSFSEDNQENQQEKQQIEPSAEANSVGGLTIEAQPTFWFYLPYVSTPETSPNRVAQFVLLDETDRPVLNELMTVELLNNPRLVEYPLHYELEPDKLYSWYFSVICDSEKRSRNPVVRGWVQRVDPTPELQTALKETSVLQQYTAYANHGIWFETMNSIVENYRQFPNSNRKLWASLLASFNLSEADQLYVLESTEPTEREVVNGNQLPARM